MSSSSDEEQLRGPSQAEHVSESTSSTASEGEKEQRGHGRVARRQRVPERDEDLIDNDILISLVHERVLLWDTRVPQHSDNVTIRRLWNEVAKAMWDGWDNAPTRVRNAFLLKVKKLWRSMKDCFNKDLRQESRVPSGFGARIRKYKYHRILAFLKPVLAQRTTWSSTVDPGFGAVLRQTATDPSQPSCSAAASGPATLPGDQEAGPSGVPLSKSSASAPFFGLLPAAAEGIRQVTHARVLHLSSVFHNGLKALGDRLDTAISHMSTRIQEVTKSLDRVKADLQRPAHHFFNQIEQGMSEHLTPDLQLSVMQACNAAYVQAMKQSRYFQQTVAAYAPVPTLSRLTSMPTSAAYHCTATSISSTAGHHYSTTTTMPSAVGQTTTMTTSAPDWTSSTDTTMQQQDPGMAFRTATTMQQQDPGMAFRSTTTMQQDPGMAFRSTTNMMLQDPGISFHSMSTMDPGMAFCSTSTMDPGMAFRSTSTMDSGMAARSMSTMDSGMAARSTSTMDSGMAARSTSAMDSGMAACSTSTVQPDPDRSSTTTMPRHMSPPRLPRTWRSQKGKKIKKIRTISIPPPSPPSVSVMSGLSHPSSASQASHVSSPIPELPDPTSIIAPSPATPASSTLSQASQLHTPHFHHSTPSRRS
ncbi:uncharacterized protein [Ranitomeya imitator]|uniref:uncharacterized protein n=1 Tax=Ranitomeya imitator TaxID=111125 RepID=UPI0037E87A74